MLTVSFADVTEGAEKTCDLAGIAGHPHEVTLSADDMKSLLAGKVVRTKSTTDRGTRTASWCGVLHESIRRNG